MKLITKIKKADISKKATLWHDANMTLEQSTQLVRDMVLSLHGCYKINSREYGDNLVDKVHDIYGWVPSMWVDERLLMGMTVLYPKKVYASFTLGLDVVEIKK